jgi:hypothetical protein
LAPISHPKSETEKQDGLARRELKGKAKPFASPPPWQQRLLMEDGKDLKRWARGRDLEMPPFRAVASTTVAALLVHGWATPKSGSFGDRLILAGMAKVHTLPSY